MSMILQQNLLKFCSMRNYTLLASLICVFMLAAVSCSPSRYMIDVEMRYKSSAGVDLTGKNVTIIYSTTLEYPISSYVESLADGFAWNLKDQYQQTIDSVSVFALNAPAENYATRDSLVSLLIKTGSDVVFLLDKVDMRAVSMKCYDAMNSDDRMLSFAGRTDLTVSDATSLATQAWDKGKNLAMSFLPEWKHEQYSIYYFGTERWYDALLKAEMYDWKGAMDIWFTFLDSNDALKRSCASFNIATACYMLGDNNLALEWLDRSDKDNLLQLSSVLRKRINARK